MTLLDTPPETRPEPKPRPEIDERARKQARADAVHEITRLAVIALATMLIAAAVFAVFDGPIGNAWYTNRQHQLAGEWAARHPHVGRGQAVGLLQIPKVGLNLLFAEGDAPAQLRSGPGHRTSTVMPGAVGNSVIVGHCSAWGGPFDKLPTLAAGDLIAVQTQSSSGPVGVFKVLSVREISGSDAGPFANSTDRRLTIVTGTGGRFGNRHVVVTAVSGPVGHLLPQGADAHANTSAGSPIWNAEMVLAVVALAIGGALVVLMRRRYRAAIVGVVAAPFVVLILLAVLLNVDATLPALR